MRYERKSPMTTMLDTAVYTPRASFLPFSPPDLSEDEIAAVVDTLRSGWISAGPKTKQFENEFRAYIGAEAALTLNSCTAGLHLALVALGIGANAGGDASDEVITTTMTFCSSVNVIEHVRATPVLVDIDPETLNLDPAAVAAAITPRTKAIIAVHIAGQPAELAPLQALAREHGLSIIEDAAHAVPARYEGQMVGAISDLTAFSFYATKNLTTGEGGMLTGKAEYVEKARLYSSHGMNRDAWKRYSASGSWFYEVVAPGFKYNMNDMQAALGLTQLARLESMQARRYEVAARYNAAFAGVEALQTPIERANVQHAWHLYILRLNLDALTIDRAGFIDALKARNIGTSVHFIPVHLHPFYRDKYGYAPESFPTAYGEFQRTVSLPLRSNLTESEIDDVIAAVLDVATVYGR
jgi:dTDP-4-amino-4,6-dideoxygalactose transaminase